MSTTTSETRPSTRRRYTPRAAPGTPEGGQFKTQSRSESQVTLTSPTKPNTRNLTGLPAGAQCPGEGMIPPVDFRKGERIERIGGRPGYLQGLFRCHRCGDQSVIVERPFNGQWNPSYVWKYAAHEVPADEAAGLSATG